LFGWLLCSASTRSSGASVELLDAEDIEAHVAARAQARRERRFGDADQIFADLFAKGVVLEDRPEGTTWRSENKLLGSIVAGRKMGWQPLPKGRRRFTQGSSGKFYGGPLSEVGKQPPNSGAGEDRRQKHRHRVLRAMKSVLELQRAPNIATAARAAPPPVMPAKAGIHVWVGPGFAGMTGKRQPHSLST